MAEQKTTEQLLLENSKAVQKQLDEQSEIIRKMATMIEELTANDEEQERSLAEIKKSYKDTRASIETAQKLLFDETVAQGDRLEAHTTEGFVDVNTTSTVNANAIIESIESNAQGLANAVSGHVQSIRKDMKDDTNTIERAMSAVSRSSHRY